MLSKRDDVEYQNWDGVTAEFNTSVRSDLWIQNIIQVLIDSNIL